MDKTKFFWEVLDHAVEVHRDGGGIYATVGAYDGGFPTHIELFPPHDLYYIADKWLLRQEQIKESGIQSSLESGWL